MFRRSVEEHAAAVAALPIRRRPPVELGLDDALHRVLAADALAPVALPLFRNSQMDGFAVRSADVRSATDAAGGAASGAGAADDQAPAPNAAVELPVVADIPAGPGTPAPLAPGTAARIMTGAVVPEGADCVVPVEDTSVAGDTVRIVRGRAPGEYVREAGSDLAAGELLVPAATRLEPRHLAALAAAGLASVAVMDRIRVAVLTTGAELVAPGGTPGPGQIFDANGPALAALLRADGAEVVALERTSDDPGEFAAVIARVAASADLVITSGGVSKGAYEVVRDVLEPRGVEFGAVAMQPGGPQGLGVIAGVPVLCFPGNPVSTQVSYTVFARPVLAAGAASTERLVHEQASVAGKRQFLRGRRTEGGVEVVGGASSHLVATMARAEVLIDVPAETTLLSAGARVRVLPL
jgi:molybdopterin molybdotransferase